VRDNIYSITLITVITVNSVDDDTASSLGTHISLSRDYENSKLTTSIQRPTSSAFFNNQSLEARP
jgi:hypothetical protein